METTFNGKKIYYETHGEGTPIVLLNGIMMSTMSWKPFVDAFSKNNKLILLDLLDQGRSSKMDCAYDISTQADVLHDVLCEIGIDKATLVGISYGVSVALTFAAKYPDMAEKLVLFNGTAKTSHWLASIGSGWKGAGSCGETYYNVTIPVIYSPEFYEKNIDWLTQRKKFLIDGPFSNKEFISSMGRLIDSSEHHDVCERLNKITAKTIVVGGELDFLTPLADQQFIKDNIKNCEMIILPGCGHASMYEKPLLFASIVLGFVGTMSDNFVI